MRRREAGSFLEVLRNVQSARDNDTLMAEANINIATFHLGRQAAEQDAIAIVGVDQIVPDIVQQKLRALPHVRYVKALKF